MKELLFAVLTAAWPVIGQAKLEIAIFDADVTPKMGTEMAYSVMEGTGVLSLRARGLVLRGAKEPLVLCSVDWIGIENESHDLFRATLAKAAGTTVDRVAVQALHPHDSPSSNLTAAKILQKHGFGGEKAESGVLAACLQSVSAAMRKAMQKRALSMA